MLDIYYYYLDYKFLDRITDICNNIFNNLDSYLIEAELNNYMGELESELYETPCLYLIEEYKNNSNILSLNFSSSSFNINFTTGKKEILRIKELALNLINEKTASINIAYIDSEKNIIRGYLLKTNNAFVICKDLSSLKSQKMAEIPLLKDVNKDLIFRSAKEDLDNITSLITYAKFNNKYYVADEIKSIFENTFQTNDIKLNYHNEKLIIEYKPDSLKSRSKKYSILLLKDYDSFYEVSKFIVIIQPYIEMKTSSDTQFSMADIIKEDEEHMKQKELNESHFHVKKETIDNVKNNIFIAGIIDFIREYILQNKDKKVLTELLYDLSLQNKDILDLAVLFDNTYEKINKSFEDSFNKYIYFNKEMYSLSEASENETSEKCNENYEFTKRLKNVNYVIIKENIFDEVNLDNMIDFKSIKIFKSKSNPSAYYVRLNKEEDLYNFSFIKINNNSLLILEKIKEKYNKDTCDKFELICTKTK